MTAKTREFPLVYDDTHMRASLRAAERISPHDVYSARKELLRMHEAKEQGWLGIVDDEPHIQTVKQAVKHFSSFKNCLVLGIGGSDLGARAVLTALRTSGNKTRIWFSGDTTDPDELSSMLDAVPWKQTCINVISKSGGTLETMSAFFEAKERLERAVGAKKAAARIICTTDPDSGALRAYAEKNGYATLPVPANIGGRFSVLTSVGLFSLGLAGVNLDALLAGAAMVRDDWMYAFGTSHAIDRFAAWHVAHGRQGRNIHVLFAYATALRDFTRWYRQIWAESLGKRRVHGGPTPVDAIGPADQHSQLQLYQEGPDNKVYTFLNVAQFASKLRVPRSVKQIQTISYASNHTFAELLHAAAQGTSQALISAQRPVGFINIKFLDAKAIGGLLMFYEVATAIAGLLFCINPFDQPGVEASKSQVRTILES